MTERFSDLWEGVDTPELTGEEATPLDRERVRNLVRARIAPKKARRRPLRRLLLAAGTAAALALGAGAAAGYFTPSQVFAPYFGEETAPLTDGQRDALDTVGRTFPDGVTSNGATLTPLAALADENCYYLRLRVEAPVGTVLPDLDGETEGYYQLFGMGKGEALELDLSAYEDYGWDLSLDWLPDDDPTDNVKEVVLRYVKQPDTALDFHDGISKPLTIHGLWVQSPDKEYTPVFTGEFTFDIGLYFESQVVEVDTLGATFTNSTYGFTNRLEELTLSPLSLSCRWSTNLEENGIIGAALGDLRIVLKDGTVFWPKETTVRNPDKRDSRFDESSVKDTFVHTYDTSEVFDAPLDLSQVDYIQYGDTKLTLPQS